MGDQHPFRKETREALEAFLAEQRDLVSEAECLRMDLHCHDYHSDVPDERLGRMLRIPETWLPTERLLRTLASNRVDAITITNHNNARVCWELLEKGVDILPGAEFSCTIPDFEVGVHVLTYGFTPEQEETLSRLRKNLYRFLEFTCENDIPTILAHPLHFYSPKGLPPLLLFDKLAVMFERFEAVNGQRDSWQNLLTTAWIQSLNEERLEAAAKRTGIRPDTFCRRPYVKTLCGGSDDHMGIFAGFTGSLLRVPNLHERRASTRVSELALEALQAGSVVPYGSHNEEEKLSLALLDYFCQVAIYMKDPGLIRLLLHRGSAKDKMTALVLSNILLELRRHRYTLKFLTAFHEALAGRQPGYINSLLVSRSMRPLFQQIDRIATVGRGSSEEMLEVVRLAIPQIFRELNLILASRVQKNFSAFDVQDFRFSITAEEFVRRFEIPSHLRMLFGSEDRSSDEGITPVNLGDLFDGLSFPALASFVIAGSGFASSRVLNKNRSFLNRFAKELGRFQHPERVLWMTDTLWDNNGVSTALRSILVEVQNRQLPIDFLVCSSERPAEGHLITVPPVAEFQLPFYKSQIFRIPDVMELHNVFRNGGYDRIVCSTEFVMGLMALYLKHAFCVPALFYLHTAWLDFADKTLGLDISSRDRIRRLLRAFYRGFDGLLVLNSEQRDWLTSSAMGIASEKIFATAHWADSHFQPQTDERARVFGVKQDQMVLLYVGRLSEEKGVLQLAEIFKNVKNLLPNVRFAVAGEGPAEPRLRAIMPDAIYLGWVDGRRLPTVYSSADVLLLPSRFDTFGCVVLEAMSCGLPVIAYNSKGPRDIIEEGISGFLVENLEEFSDRIVRLSHSSTMRRAMRRAALSRSKLYKPDEILDRLMENLGIRAAGSGARKRPMTKINSRPEQDPTPAQPSFLQELLEIVTVE